jgi:hypothetical protein
MQISVLKHQPGLWIHGHTNWSTDYEIGRTRVRISVDIQTRRLASRCNASRFET